MMSGELDLPGDLVVLESRWYPRHDLLGPLENAPVGDLASLHADHRLGVKTGHRVAEHQALVRLRLDVRASVAHSALDLEEVGEVRSAGEAELEPDGLGARVEHADLLEHAVADESEPSYRERVGSQPGQVGIGEEERRRVVIHRPGLE